MRIRQIILLAAFAIAPATGALGQESAMTLPAACTASEPMKMGDMKMGDMKMESMAMGDMGDAHKAYMQAMMKMHPAMMQGISAKDPDVAFACGMIAHHQGAIDMSQVELKFGKDDDAKKKAQMIIDAQTKEIEEFTQWLSAHAK